MYLASLPWYDFPEIRPATDALWARLAHNLRVRGFGNTPISLERRMSYQQQWTSGTLLFSQACGYDVVLPYASHLRIVATPIYKAAGCHGPCYNSFVVVHRDSRITDLQQLRGSRCVINGLTSHSGMNSLRALVAPLHRGGRFFSEVYVSGSHELSLARLDEGKADVAAIDCITYEILRRYRPRSLSEIRILCSCASMPAPPYVVGAQLSDCELQRVGEALAETLEDPTIQGAKDVLLLDRIEKIPLADYEPIATLEREALRRGYAEISSSDAARSRSTESITMQPSTAERFL